MARRVGRFFTSNHPECALPDPLPVPFEATPAQTRPLSGLLLRELLTPEIRSYAPRLQQSLIPFSAVLCQRRLLT
jgi:hypothetical protein